MKPERARRSVCSDTPDIVAYEQVDPEQVAEKEQAASHAETDANLVKRAAVSKFKQHIAEEASEHQAEAETEIRVEEEKAAELQSQVEMLKKSLEVQQHQAVTALRGVTEHRKCSRRCNSSSEGKSDPDVRE